MVGSDHFCAILYGLKKLVSVRIFAILELPDFLVFRKRSDFPTFHEKAGCAALYGNVAVNGLPVAVVNLTSRQARPLCSHSDD